jgi:hypothetical protein
VISDLIFRIELPPAAASLKGVERRQLADTLTGVLAALIGSGNLRGQRAKAEAECVSELLSPYDP